MGLARVATLTGGLTAAGLTAYPAWLLFGHRGRRTTALGELMDDLNAAVAEGGTHVIVRLEQAVEDIAGAVEQRLEGP